MVSNSYDADATIVSIKVDLKNKELVLEDNGNGMSAEQFDNYLRIAGQPSEGSEGGELSPKFQRRRIGRFGVGFLAAFPFCESLEMTSKRQGAETGFIAEIPAERYIRGVGTEEEVSRNS
jgi:HSP90 family molecular chaperone